MNYRPVNATMVLNLREELDAPSCCAPLAPRTLPSDWSSWPVPLTVVGLLMLAATVPVVSGQRGLGVSGDTSPYKGYSGIRVRSDAKRVSYYHEQTIAVVELGNNRELYNCELIEV